MIKNFEASNGISIFLEEAPPGTGWLKSIGWSTPNRQAGDRDPEVLVFRMGSEVDAALAEWYQHRRDQELGRKRWPENPDYVVYLQEGSPRVFNVFDEKTSYTYTYEETTAFLGTNKDMFVLAGQAAKWFSQTFPKPKPWQNAQDGEVWELFVERYEPGEYWLARNGEFMRKASSSSVSVDSPAITGGRRVWPEGGGQ